VVSHDEPPLARGSVLGDSVEAVPHPDTKGAQAAGNHS